MSDVALFHATHSKLPARKISGELLSTGHVKVDWSQLPKHDNTRRYVIHWKSLNSNRSEAVRVSRRDEQFVLRKVEPGHLYEIHVCAVDRTNRILESSDRTQIQTKTLNQAPTLRLTKLSPDCIWLEWEKSDDIQQGNIRCYRLNTNGQTTAVLPANENRFVFNDGEVGQRYIFQLEMNTKDGKTASSVPVSIVWPGVSFPDHHVFINGCQELIICWGNPKSISDGTIESYTLHLFDAKQRLLSDIGPNPPECRQVWIKDISKGVYFYVLEIKLANSNRSQSSQMQKIECGRETKAPILTYQYTDSYYREKLFNTAFQLVKLRDNMKTNRWQDKCEHQLHQTLSTFANLTDVLRLTLTIESKSSESKLKSYRVVIDENETSMSMPAFVKEFPLELRRREKPYEISLLVTPDPYAIKSNKILIEAAGHFPFFCAHFNQRRSIESCSYINTLAQEKQQKRLFHHGLLKSPLKFTEIQVYDLNEDKIIPFPSPVKGHRLSVVLFYLKRCVPSQTHLRYFSAYASSNHAKYNYISINCGRDDLDELKELSREFVDIQRYTDFAPEDFKYPQNTTDRPIHELLSLEGVPTYFILDYSSRIVWKGRLCVRDQSTYDRAMNHIISEFQQQPCSTENCDLCSYCSMTDAQIASELNFAAKELQSITEQHSIQSVSKQQEDKHNRTRRVFSLKSKSDYH